MSFCNNIQCKGLLGEPSSNEYYAGYCSAKCWEMCHPPKLEVREEEELCETCNTPMSLAGPIGYYCTNDHCPTNDQAYRLQRVRESQKRDRLREIRIRLTQLSDEERLEVFSEFCTYCGSPTCDSVCVRDE